MSKQNGAAVLATVLMVVMLAVLMRAYGERASIQKNHYQASHRQSLAFARDALIDFAVNYPSHYADRSAGPGHLPCPDRNGNGSPSLGCGGLAIGFLPVDFGTGENKNISLLERQAVTGEPLWYVVSSAFRNNPAPNGSTEHNNIVNSDTRGELQLDEEPEIIALLIAPGPALAGQDRSDSVNVADYLEGENADGDYAFAHGQGNDRILAIRWQDLMPLVERRVLAAARDIIENYRTDHGHMPWLAELQQPMQLGDSTCVPCQWEGLIATERYYNSRAWPEYHMQSCVDTTTSAEHEQATPVLPIWFASNYWHRHVWMHLESDERGGLCPLLPAPVFEQQPVSAVIVSTGRALLNPQHGKAPQDREPTPALNSHLDHSLWVDGDGSYPALKQTEGVNDQWSTLP